MKMNVRSDGASPSKNVRKYDGGGAVATQVFPGRGVLQGVETYDGNHLPHWTMGHVLYHVCFRLADSVPVEKLREWQNERKAFAELRSDGALPSGSDTQRLKYLYSEKIEKYLDSGYGECLLRSDGALAVVRATIKHDDGEKYHIHAYGIMPNHVHVIVELKEGFLLRDVMQEWKSVSGHRINRMLSRTGALWQPDYYNHIIRTPDEYGFQMNYVFKNNLVESWRLPSNDESGNDGEGAVATQGNDGEGEGNDGGGEGNDGGGAVATQGKVTKIAAGVARSIVAVVVVACACLAGGAEPVRDLPFPLTSVRLTGGPLQAQQEQNRRYLLRLEPDRLLSRFRSEAGLKPKAEPYGGWENPALKRDRWIALPGHILAFWMSGAAMPSIPRSAVEKPDGCLERTACSPLTFRMAGTDTLLKPLFALHFSRYTTYWRVMGAEEDRDFTVAEAKAAEYARRAVDGVSPADYWSEKCHSLAAGNSETGVNIYGGPKSFGWRGAKGPAGKAFFSYRFAVGAAPGGRTLVARYRNCEKGARAFDVLVDGKKVFTESLKDSGRRGFIFREIPIPQELVAGKKEIEVRFEPKPGNIAGGLFGLWLIPSGVPIR